MRLLPLRSGRGQAGQAAVETAIVMPLNVFLLLGIIQLGLISQARLMAKYAAYRAVRVGAMNSADVTKMTDAALLTLLPVIATGGDNSSTSQESYTPVNSVTGISEKMVKARVLNVNPIYPLVKVVICGPLSKDFSGVTQNTLASGDSNQVDFDDPRVTDNNGNLNNNFEDYRKYMRTKLRIQVQFLYRMPIPFANWIIARSYLGMHLPDVMRMSTKMDLLPPGGFTNTYKQATQVYAALQRNVFITPINVSYAMRMQSNFMLRQHQLPQENDCIHYPSAGDAKDE